MILWWGKKKQPDPKTGETPIEPLKPGEVGDIGNELMDDEQKKQFAQELEMNLAISIPGA